jgi:hypothetical protein
MRFALLTMRSERVQPWLNSAPLRQARIIVQITKQARPAIKARAEADMQASVDAKLRHYPDASRTCFTSL